MLDADAVIIVLQLAAEMIFETATRHDRRRIRAEEEVYWHVTGGQRLLTLAISKFIEDGGNTRKNDKL